MSAARTRLALATALALSIVVVPVLAATLIPVAIPTDGGRCTAAGAPSTRAATGPGAAGHLVTPLRDDAHVSLVPPGLELG